MKHNLKPVSIAEAQPAIVAASDTNTLTLKSRKEIADGTMAFHFEKPAGFSFKAGQAIELILIDPPHTDAKGSGRPLSIVSAPYEDELVVATRIRDTAFKRVLRELPVGATIRFDGPFGSLTLQSNRSRPAIFIAGGIGITPFMSILRQTLKERLPQVMKLVYSNRRPEDAAFLEELIQLERQHRGQFQFVPTMTGEAPSGRKWAGRTGMVDVALLAGIIVRPSAPIFYVAGPPAMVSAMRDLLNGIGVQDDDIRSEDFSGY
ncbi:MAG: ferredoxin--NADP reductase [Armatimonadota bacterium]